MEFFKLFVDTTIWSWSWNFLDREDFVEHIFIWSSAEARAVQLDVGIYWLERKGTVFQRESTFSFNPVISAFSKLKCSKRF